MYRKRFGLTGHPLPKNAQGKTFYDDSPPYRRLERAFRQLVDEPGVGLITGEPGVGKTAALRNLCATLPKPDNLVLYLCDTAVSPLDLYRTLAQELGVAPSHRRGQLWTDIKKVLVHLVDERHTQPLLVLDEAQHLSDKFLLDLSGFLNFAFDSRELLTLWLVGLPALGRTPLAMSALDRATSARTPAVGMVHHSDRGSVYASGDYGDALEKLGAVKSMSRKGDCWDNAVAEPALWCLNGLGRRLGFEEEVEAKSCSRGLTRTARGLPSWGQQVCRAHPPPTLPLCYTRSRRQILWEVSSLSAPP